MKLQLVETRRGNAVYEKFQTVLPSNIIVEAGWHEGDELEFYLDRKRRIVVSAHHPTLKRGKPESDYDTIRLAVWSILNTNPHGLTWTQIREKSSALPKKPSPFLVARLEADLGLMRVIDKKTGRRNWQLQARTTSIVHLW